MAKKKREPPADAATFRDTLSFDTTLVENLTNLNMEKQSTTGKTHCLKSPHIKTEPSFLGELKVEVESVLGRQLTPDEDILAIAVTILRQSIAHAYITSDALTASIKATDERRWTRKSGVEVNTDKDEMKKQLDANFKNMQQMETLLAQDASPHDGSAQSESVAISVFGRPIQDFIPIQLAIGDQALHNIEHKDALQTYVEIGDTVKSRLRNNQGDTRAVQWKSGQ